MHSVGAATNSTKSDLLLVLRTADSVAVYLHGARWSLAVDLSCSCGTKEAIAAAWENALVIHRICRHWISLTLLRVSRACSRTDQLWSCFGCRSSHLTLLNATPCSTIKVTHAHRAEKKEDLCTRASAPYLCQSLRYRQGPSR